MAPVTMHGHVGVSENGGVPYSAGPYNKDPTI